jgi:pimeloyl-ACP methyl ester carboxylesterase
MDRSAATVPAVSNEPVVLVHGWGGSFASTWQGPGWEALLQDAGRTVIGVDLLGHGTAPKPHEPADYEDLTARIIDALPSDGQVDAVGFSMGAATLLELAGKMPERIHRLVVAGVGKNLFEDDPERRQVIIDAVEGRDTDNNIGRLFAQYAGQTGNDRVALAACMKRTGTRVTAERLAAVTMPVLVAIGDKDFAGPADQLVEALPDARLVTLKGVDHFATPESFAFIDATLGFLDAVPA